MIKYKKGLTLIELLAVIAIIAILFILLIPQINNAINKARETGVMMDFRSYEIAAKSFFMENEDGDKNISTFNKYLDNELKLNMDAGRYFKSSKVGSLGVEYTLVTLSDTVFNLYTKGPNDPIAAELLVTYEDGEIKTRTYGLSSNIGETGRITDGDIEYIEFFNNELTAFDYKGMGGIVKIPDDVDGKPVRFVSRAGGAWKTGFGNRNITELNLGKNIFYIGQQAFAFNSIKNVILPDTLTTTGPSSFASNDISNILFNDKLTHISRASFFANEFNHLDFSDNIRKIEFQAFTGSQNENFTYKIHNNTFIEDDAFPTTAVKTN